MEMALFAAFGGLLLIACLLAYWRGGGPERAVAAMYVMAWLSSIASRLLTDFHYRGTPAITLGIDILLLVALLAVARRANRAWPVLVVSLQLLVVLAHGARVINQHQLPFIYIVMTEFWPYLQIIVLITGTLIHWKRTATGAAVPSWKN